MICRNCLNHGFGGLLACPKCGSPTMSEPEAAEELARLKQEMGGPLGAMAEIYLAVTDGVDQDSPPDTINLAKHILDMLFRSGPKLRRPGYFRHDYEREAWEHSERMVERAKESRWGARYPWRDVIPPPERPTMYYYGPWPNAEGISCHGWSGGVQSIDIPSLFVPFPFDQDELEGYRALNGGPGALLRSEDDGWSMLWVADGGTLIVEGKHTQRELCQLLIDNFPNLAAVWPSSVWNTVHREALEENQG